MAYDESKRFANAALRKKIALNDFRFRVVGPRLQGSPTPCTIGFDMAKGGVRFNAFTNIPDDEDHGVIRAELSLQDSFLVVTMLEEATRLAPGTSNELAVAAAVFDPKTRTRTLRPSATIRIGRDDSGVIYIRMASWKSTRPIVMIPLIPSNIARLGDGRGNLAAPDKVSELVALSWAKALSEMLPATFIREYERLNISTAPAAGPAVQSTDNAAPAKTTQSNSDMYGFGDELPM